MNKINKKILLAPGLRFSEFESPWVLRKLGPYIEQYIERVPANTKIPILTSSRTGLYKQSDYFDNRELANKGEYGVVPRGYFTYRHMSDDSTFKFNINNLCDKGAVSKEYPVFKTIKMDSVFLHHKLNYGNELKRFAIAQKLGGTRVRLYYKKLKELEFNIPTLPEQQKIASFLSAVDEKVQQLTRKKELLEQYKKGVMQQLFSGKLRFKDESGKAFPKWGEKRIWDVSEKQSSNIAANAITQSNGDYKIYGATGFLKNVDFYQEEEPYISIVKDGAGVGRTFLCDAKTSVLGTLDIIKPIANVELYYLFSVLNYIDFAKYTKGSTIPHIYYKDYSTERIQLPHLEEQKKIASYLSTIDTKIEIANKQLTQTQSFKKGLLQQMFV